MPLRTLRRAVLAAAGLGLAGCGAGPGGDGIACTGSTWKAQFDGTGSQKLPSTFGADAKVEVTAVSEQAVTAKVAGREVKLVRAKPQRVGSSTVTLTAVDGQAVTLRLVGP